MSVLVKASILHTRCDNLNAFNSLFKWLIEQKLSRLLWQSLSACQRGPLPEHLKQPRQQPLLPAQTGHIRLFFARLFRFQPPALTVSDELNEVQHRLVQIDSVKHDRFKISVLEGPHQPDCDHSFPGHVPPDPRYRTGRCPLDEARFLREYRLFLRLRSRDGPSKSRSVDHWGVFFFVYIRRKRRRLLVTAIWWINSE